MAEVDNEITVVGSDGVIENHSSDAAPLLERAPLEERQSARRPFIGYLDVEGERALGLRIALVENLRHDLVAKIQRFAFDLGLLRRDQQAHETRRACGLPIWFAELSDLVELALRRLLIDALKDHARDQ